MASSTSQATTRRIPRSFGKPTVPPRGRWTIAIGPIGAAPLPTLPTDRRPHLASGQSFFFSAVDSNAGVELFALTNDPPAPAADNATSDAGAAVTINVLGNDTDSDGSLDPSSVRITSNPAHGTVTINGDGSIIYTPTAGYAGQDTFAYAVADNQDFVSAPAQVTVDVKATVTVTPPKGSSGGGGGPVGYRDIAALLTLIGLRTALKRYPSGSRSCYSYGCETRQWQIRFRWPIGLGRIV
jgi:Bacterial Ig domain